VKPFEKIRHLGKAHPLYGMPDAEGGGYFEIGRLRIVASWQLGWDHVSVSLPDRCPTWDEMERVKRAFFQPWEVVMQLHVATADHINCHPYCLHLWRPHAAAIPLPPKEFVA
jgi:hypothetical protein